ncbi:MAG TPA: acyl carrier protein [Gemmatimonadales bacterium]
MSVPRPSEAEIVTRARTWVRENFLYMRPDWKLGDDDPLLGSGVIDSIGVIELVGFLQSAFDFTIADDDIVESNLGSLAAIGRFVHAKCRHNGAGAEVRPEQVA